MIFILIKFLLDGVFDVRKGKEDEKKGITKFFVREGAGKQKAKVLAVGEREDLEKEKETLEAVGSQKSRHASHCCFYCMEESSRINMHYKRKHGSETRVAEIMKLTDPAQKRWGWKRLVNEGDQMYNTLVLKGKGGELKTMRKGKLPERSRKYVSCNRCAGRILARSLKKHQKICLPSYMEKANICGETSIQGNLEDDGFYEEVVKAMRGDLPKFVLKNQTIYDFGKNLWYEKGFRLVNVVREKLRDLYDISKEIEKIKEGENIEEFFNVRNVDSFVAILKKTSGFSKKGKTVHFDTPSKVLRYLRLMSDFGNFLRISYIKLEKKNKVKCVEDFLHLLDYECNKKLKKFINLNTLDTKRQGVVLPKENEIKQFIDYLKDETSQIIQKLEGDKNEKDWRKLAENILIRLTIFNRRRGGACEKLLLSQYEKSKPVEDEAKDDAMFELDDAEKDYLKSLRVIEIVHKAHNLVPIYITLDLQQAIETLIKYRYVANVETNPYVFAAGKGSKNPIRGTDVFLKYKSLLPEDSRKRFTATNLRKQGATATQFLDLSNQDKEGWSKHMGHTIEVHNRFYRLRDRPSNIINTGKILQILEQGEIKTYKGKSLNEIDLGRPSTSKEISTAPESTGDFSPTDSDWNPTEASGSSEDIPKKSGAKKRGNSRQELTPKTKKKTKKNPITPHSKQSLLKIYRHHLLKGTLPGKSEICKNLNDTTLYSKIRNMDWKRHKDFIRNSQVSAKRRKLFSD